MTQEEIGKALRFRREFLGYKQEDLEAFSGISSKTIRLIEKGEGNPTLETLDKLIGVLGMEILLQVKKVI